ncbi:MAG: hypothetical protein QHC90_26160 [Shinella sp.]|nr:hypothetical protein [Shinella sp.]
MAISEKFIVLPYRKNRNNLVPGEMRQASNAVAAARVAANMAPRHVGVAAYAVMVDTETGDMSSPRLLASFGDVMEMSALLDAA